MRGRTRSDRSVKQPVEKLRTSMSNNLDQNPVLDQHDAPEPTPGRAPHDLAAIPVQDAGAALRFCQTLAAAMNTSADTLTVNHPPPPTVAFNGAVYAEDAPRQMPTTMPRPDISVVLPFYNEEANLPILYERLTTVLRATGLTYELVFIDDGSKDASVACMHDLIAHDPRIILVELARNFGHQVALSAGLEYTRGRGVIVMDTDLQDPPEVLPQFIARWQEGYEVVYAIREQRKEHKLLLLGYKLFYRVLQRASHIDIPLDSGDFCIMDRRVVDVLVAMPERNRFVRGIRSWVGFSQVGLAYERHARNAGKPKYTLRRLITLAMDGIISFSYMPLRAITTLGLVVSVFALGMAAFYAFQRLALGLNPPGFPTIIVAVFFLSGIQLITLGVMGEYVGRIFEEVKQRPLYTVRRVSGLEHRAAPEAEVYAHSDA
jgi:dolichol-phosphate mannosyltransferase